MKGGNGWQGDWLHPARRAQATVREKVGQSSVRSSKGYQGELTELSGGRAGAIGKAGTVISLPDKKHVDLDSQARQNPKRVKKNGGKDAKALHTYLRKRPFQKSI